MTLQDRTKHFKHEEMTSRIIQACFDVSNELGAGFAVEFRGTKVGLFFADIVIEDKILIELKAISNLQSEHKAQVINY